MCGWWVLLQSWGTMRFSDHRGLSPADISFTDGSLTGLLRRTKTTGTDKNESARPVRVDARSLISSPPVALSRLADPERAGPMPKGLSPSSPSWSIRQMSADGAQARPGLRHSEPVCWRAWSTARVPKCSQQKPLCSGRLARGGHSSQLHSGIGVPERGTGLPRRVVSPRERHPREDGEAPYLVNAEICVEQARRARKA